MVTMGRWWTAVMVLMVGATFASAEPSFEWHWGNWQVIVSGEKVQVRYRRAPIAVLTPPPGVNFREGGGRLSVVILRWHSSGGEGVWTIGATPTNLTVIAQHPLLAMTVSPFSWHWVTLNPNLLSRATMLPSGERWLGTTVFGKVRIALGGAGAQVRWQSLPQAFCAELLYSSGITQLTAQLEMGLPPHWLVAEPVTGEPSVHPMDLVQGEFWDGPIIPQPQWFRWGDFSFRLARKVTLFVSPEGDYERAAEHLRRDLQERWLRQVTVRQWTPDMSSLSITHHPSLPSERGIVIAPHHSLRDMVAEIEPMLRHELPPEGYALAATPQGIWILSAGSQGAFWGVQTLKQLFRLTEDGGLIVPCVFIRDYPDFSFRGVHIVADDYSPEFHTRLIERVLAPLKFNRLIVQLDHLKWERHPELWQPWSLPKDGAKRLQQVAEANGMEVIPLLPTLSHCEYLFVTTPDGKGRVNLDIAENPEVPYSYCPNLERSYQLIFDLLDEVLTLFNPRWVHIGHDELTNQRRRFGQCIRCQGMPPSHLFASDVQRLYDFLKGRGVGVMMWGDMLLRPDEASDAAHGGEPFNFWLARQLIPKDIIILDWHYQPAPHYPSIRSLKEEGFSVIGATWRNPLNIFGFSRAAKDAGAWGMVQTTWTGFGNNRNSLRESPDQFAAYVTAAENFWSVGKPLPKRSGYSAQAIFETLWREKVIQPTGGFVVDLTPAANIYLAKLLGASPSTVQGNRRWWNRRLFWLPADEQGSVKGLALRSVWLEGSPDEITLSLNERAAELTFIHACGFAVSDEKTVGSYEIQLANGNEIAVPLVYGHNIRALTDSRPLRDLKAFVAWHWTTPKGTATLTALTVPLPSEQEVKGIRFFATDNEAAPILVALTGVAPEGITEEAP